MSAITFSLGGIGLTWLLGTLLVLVLCPRLNDRPLAIFLGWAVGVGVTSAVFFLAARLSANPLLVSLPVELAIIALLFWIARRWKATALTSAQICRREPHAPAVVVRIFWLAAIAADGVAGVAWLAEPYGGWDGWALWNMKARFLLEGGPQAMALMAQPQLSWTHPDYPLLLPATVARAWAFGGEDSAFAAGVISTLFGVCTVGALVRVSARLSSEWIGYVGGIALLTTPAFVRTASNEHADIPFGFMMLSATGMMLIARQSGNRGGVALAGLIAGFSAWTKNEGLLFCVVLAATFVVFEVRSRRGSLVPWLVAGLAAPIALVCWFKFTLVPPNDILAGQNSGSLARVVDWDRHSLIFHSFARDLVAFGAWPSLVPVVALALCLAGYVRRGFTDHSTALAAVLGLMVAGYYSVYLVSPFDLTWHLDSSLVRLLLQLWPLALLLWAALFPLKAAARAG